MTVPALGLTMLFNVTVGTAKLGNWSTCKGLDVKYVRVPFKELGTNDHEHYFLDNVQYSPVKLERAVEATSAKALQTWLRDQTAKWDAAGTTLYAGDIAAITLFSFSGSSAPTAVCSWSLRGVYPSAWSGPALDANRGDVALETLELVHQGFL